MPHLVLIRHGQSEFNAKGLWTGDWDVPLTDQGHHEAQLLAHLMADLRPDVAYSSQLSRAKDTLDIILRTNRWDIPVHRSKALNERDYGALTGRNKAEIQEKYGPQQFQNWRRGWDQPVPEGETLKQVYQRVVPYFDRHILPQLKAGQNVLITGHGNSLRALIKHLDVINDDEISYLEMPVGDIFIYHFGHAGTIISRDHRRI